MGIGDLGNDLALDTIMQVACIGNFWSAKEWRRRKLTMIIRLASGAIYYIWVYLAFGIV